MCVCAFDRCIRTDKMHSKDRSILFSSFRLRNCFTFKLNWNISRNKKHIWPTNEIHIYRLFHPWALSIDSVTSANTFGNLLWVFALLPMTSTLFFVDKFGVPTNGEKFPCLNQFKVFDSNLLNNSLENRSLINNKLLKNIFDENNAMRYQREVNRSRLRSAYACIRSNERSQLEMFFFFSFSFSLFWVGSPSDWYTSLCHLKLFFFF